MVTLKNFDFNDTRFFKPRDTWRVLNVPPFNDEFSDWLDAHIPGTKIERHYKRARSHGGWGNKGGWTDKPTSIDLIFPSESAELYFRMKWNMVNRQ
jgi:hypothetical protein